MDPHPAPSNEMMSNYDQEMHLSILVPHLDGIRDEVEI